VGGPPGNDRGAVMPLPEGMSELGFAGLLGRRRVAMICRPNKLPIAPRPIFASRLSGSQAAEPEGRSAIIWLLPVWRTSFPCCTSSTCITARERSGRSRSWAGRRRKIRSSAMIHELAGETITKIIPGIKRCMRWTRPACIRCFWPSAAALRAYDERRRPRELLTLGQCAAGSGAIVAG